MSQEKISVYVDKKFVMKTDIFLSESLQELRSQLEKTIPNELSFIKEGSSIKKEKEKELTIKDIIDKYNSIYLRQDYFVIFLDNEIIKKNVELFKHDSEKTLIHNYKEILPKIFYVKCEPNIFVQIDYAVEENIQIGDLLTGNSIYIYSQINPKKIKNNFDDKKFGYMLKEKGKISFINFNTNNLDIFETLILDEKYDKYLEESKYETRKKVTSESFKNLDKIKDNAILKDELKKIISQDNMNTDAVFEYLKILKISQDPSFKEKLKKYSFLLDINQLKLLNNSFKGELYENYFDEKTNLIKFFEKVIEDDFKPSLNLDGILSEIDFRHSIQAEIITPFINDFNKENYINNPIPVSDNNLFFHYLRVKFLTFLQGAFDIKEELQMFCEELLNKINIMTKDQNRKSKTRLLLEILCMISIYKFHSEELKMVISYYSHKLEMQYNNLYHPIIFFNYVKDTLFKYYKMIANSNCVKSAMKEYKEIINHNSEKPAELDIQNSFNYLIRNTIFIPFFSNSGWDLTTPAFNISFINIDIFCLQNNFKNENKYPDYFFLFYFVKYIISFLHEPIGHNFKIYESYNNNIETLFDSPRIMENNKEKKYEGGYLMEALCLNSVEKLNIEHVLFLLNENSWSLDHKLFLEKFKGIKEPNLENCMSLIENGKMIKELLSILKITRNSIKNAIKNKVILDTQYSDGLNNETGVMHRSNNDGHKVQEKEKERAKRICRIKSYY